MKKIAFDFDGTIADTNAMKSVLVKERLGLDIPAWQCDRTLLLPQIGETEYFAISDVVYDQEYTLKTPPLPQAIEHIKALATKFEINLLTARPALRLEYAIEWLEKYELKPCFNELLSSHLEDKLWRPKLEICREKEFELLVEDDLRHFMPDGFFNIAKILIKPGCEQALELPKNVHLVNAWDGIYQFCMDALN